jgi:hypothetical protein
MKNYIQSLDDINDISILIVDKMVEQGIIPDCTDTDNEIEFEVQDIIREILCDKFKINQ